MFVRMIRTIGVAHDSQLTGSIGRRVCRLAGRGQVQGEQSRMLL